MTASRGVNGILTTLELLAEVEAITPSVTRADKSTAIIERELRVYHDTRGYSYQLLLYRFDRDVNPRDLTREQALMMLRRWLRKPKKQS